MAAGLVTLGIGALSLAGWAFGIPVLTEWLPGLPAMSLDTAVWLVAIGAALALLAADVTPGRRRAAQILAGLTLALTLGALGAFALDRGLSLVSWVVPHWAGPTPAPNTVVAIALAAVALLGDRWQTGRGSRPAEWFGAIILVIALLSLIGYAYNARRLYAIPSYTALALNTALALAALGGGILCLRPGEGWMAQLTHPGAGGHMVRRILPAAIGIPIVLGALRAGDHPLGWLHSRIGLALLTVGNVVALAFVIIRNGRSLNELDERRALVEGELRRTNEALEVRVEERTAALRGEIEERRRAEERVLSLIEAAPDAIILNECHGRIVLLNSRAETLFGSRRKDMLGHLIGELLPGYQIVCADSEMHTEDFEVRRTDGTRVPVSVAISVIRSGGDSLVFNDIRDVTDREQAQAALEARERRFRAVADTANDAIISADMSGRITYFNPAAEMIFGYPADQLLNTPLERLMPERYRRAHAEGLRRFLETGEGRLIGESAELVGLRRNGQEFPVELSLSSWVEGGRHYFTGILRDVTRRRETETRIANLNHRLQQRALELENLNHELEAFSYSVSHDLRAPLRSIDGFSQALLEDYAERLDAQGRDYLGRVRLAAQRMGHLIDDLLKLARVTRAEIVMRPVDVTALAVEAGAVVAARHPEHKVDFVVAPGLIAEGDEALLRVAFENLLDNAWKFTAGRGPARVEVGMIDRTFFVLDNGVGFDPAYAGKLFRPFSRLHDQKAFPGTGIGLATVQRVVHKHGGTIRAESAPGQGTAFYFTLRPDS